MATPARRQSTSGAAYPTGTLTLTLPGAIAAGSALLLSVFAMDDLNTVASPPTIATPSGGGVTWVQAASSHSGAGTGSSALLKTFYGLSASGGATTVTVAVTGGGGMAGILEEVTNVSAVLSQPDGAAVSGAGAPGGTPMPAHATTHDVDWLWAAWGGEGDRAKLDGPTEAYSEVDYVTTALGAPNYDVTLAAADRLQTVHGTHQPMWTVDITASWTGHALGLKAIGPASSLEATVKGEATSMGILTAPSNINVPAAYTTFPERWLFVPKGRTAIDFATMGIAAVKRTGMNDHPALRGNDAPWAGRPGEQQLGKLAGSRVVPLTLMVMPRNPDGSEPGTTDAIATRTRLDSLQTGLALRTQGQLIEVMPDGTARAAWAEVVSVAEVDNEVRPVLIGLVVSFKLADPWFYGNLVVTGPTTISASPTVITVTNAGSVATDRPILELFGPLTNPVVFNRANSVSFRYDGAIASGQMLLVDAGSYQALLGGASVVGALTHFGANAFMRLEPGTNDLEVSTDVTGGSVKVRHFPPYV